MDEPVQFAASVSTPAVQDAARHDSLEGRNASAGHAAELPVHSSAASQTPFAARHSNVDGRKASTGHAVDEPLQLSATSQMPFAARQTWPAAIVVQVPTLPVTLQA